MSLSNPVSESAEPSLLPLVSSNLAVEARAESKSAGWLSVARIGCGLGLIAASLWALLLPPLFPYSVHAIVNTKVVAIKAQDAGRLGELPAGRAFPVKAGDALGRVERDEAKLQRELELLGFERLKLREQLDSVEQALAAREARLAEAEAEVGAAKEGSLRLLTRSREAAVDKVRLYREGHQEKLALQERVAPLFTDGIVTAAQWSATRDQTLQAEKALRAAEAELMGFEEGLRGGGAGDPTREVVEGMSSRVSALEREISGLRLQRIDQRARLAEVEARAESIRAQRETDRAYELRTPIDGVIWRRQAVNGETLSEGQVVAEVADTASLFVEAYFRRDFMNSISVGDRASIYLVGEGRFVEGRVTDIQVQERTSKEPDVINTLSLDASMLRVRVEVEPGQLAPEQLGQLAKVLTSGGRAGALERGLIWLSFTLRSHK